MFAGLQNMALSGNVGGPIDFSRMMGTGTPSYEDIMSGRDMLRFEKVPVKFSDFKARIFDMTVPEEAEEYGRTILEIMQGVQTRQMVLLKHETKPMRCRNGEEGWKNYVEWAKYELNDSLIDQIRKSDKEQESNDGGQDGSGVFAEI